MKTNKGGYDWSKYNSIEAIQEFIDQNGILSYSELRNDYSGLRGHITANKICIPTRDLIFPNSKKQEYWRDLNTKQEIQKFIDDHSNEIRTSGDFQNKYPGLSRKVPRLGYNIKDFKFPEKVNTGTVWKYFETLDDFQKFIDEESVQTVQEFKKNYPGLERRFRRRGFSTSQLKFPKKYKSRLEVKLEKFLINNGINFISQKTFDDLGKSRFDFYLPEYNLILEPGGDQHFIEIEKWKGKGELSKTKERDKKKYEYCINNDITVLYYFEFSKKETYKLLTENGYFGEWFTDFDLFVNRIFEIIKNGKS